MGGPDPCGGRLDNFAMCVLIRSVLAPPPTLWACGWLVGGWFGSFRVGFVDSGWSGGPPAALWVMGPRAGTHTVWGGEGGGPDPCGRPKPIPYWLGWGPRSLWPPQTHTVWAVGGLQMTGRYHIMSYHIVSYHIISYHIISYHIISYLIISYHIIS